MNTRMIFTRRQSPLKFMLQVAAGIFMVAFVLGFITGLVGRWLG